MNIIAKLLQSIISSDFIILVCAIITLLAALKVRKYQDLVGNDIYDWEEKSNDMSNNPEKTNKIFNSYRRFNRCYTVFITLISIFPLLGMLGTVIALLSIDMNDTAAINAAQSSFLDALTSTTWGIIFSVIFKVANAYFFADVENLINRLLELKKKLIKDGVDESIKNKSRWRI